MRTLVKCGLAALVGSLVVAAGACIAPFETTTGGTAGAGTGGAGTASGTTSTATMTGSGGATSTSTTGTGGGLQGCTCVPVAPAGWSNVGWVGTLGATVGCPMELPNQTDLFDKQALMVPPAACSCICDTASGVSCGSHLQCADSMGSCMQSGNAFGQKDTCGTNNLPSGGFPAFCRASAPGAEGGTCAPAAKGPMPVAWKASARLCATSKTSGGCAAANQVCVPKPPGAMGPCVTRMGDQTCPAPYTNKVSYFDGKVTDTRSCDATPCTCGGPMGATCGCGVGSGCTLDLYLDQACGNVANALKTDDTCSLVATAPQSTKLIGAMAMGGECMPNGSAQTKGNVQPAGPVTLCCVP